MLTIHFGDMDGVVYNTPVYFNNTYSIEWFGDPFAQKMVKGTVLGPNAIETKILGVIPPEKLSGGLKTLILCQNASITLQTVATIALVGFLLLRRGMTLPSIYIT